MKKLISFIFLTICVLLLSGCFLLPSESKTYHSVTFEVDGDSTSLRIEDGKKVEKIEDPTKEGYEFIGWYLDDSPYDFSKAVKKDITLVAKFEEKVKDIYYTVTFKDYNGKVLKEERVLAGASATPPENPTREGYEFVSWDRTFESVTSNIVVNALYQKNASTFVVYFLDFDGSVLKQEEVVEGGSATPPSTPTRDGYNFLGWDDDYTNITTDLLIYAEYEIKTFKVTFKDYDGRVLKEQTVNYNESATAPKSPTRDGYKFASWDKAYTNVKSDLTVTATYTLLPLKVTFKDYDGRVIKEEEVEKGKSATAPANPTREGYDFNGWDKSFTSITSSITVTATYKVKTFKVTFKDYDGKVLKEQTVNYNENATAPASPTRDGYNFISWDKDYTKVKEVLTVTAVYEKQAEDATYAIVYNLGDGTWEANNKNEYIKLFLTDFYNFVSPTESKNEFIYGDNSTFTGTWKNYLGGYFPDGTNKLLKANDFSLDDNAYFLNSSLYKTKWADLANYVKAMNKRFGDQKEANYYGGSIDFYRYCINDPQGYASVYGDAFYAYPNDIQIELNSYKKSNTDIVLPSPYRDDFEGWYLNANYSGSKVEKIVANTTGAITLYAKWKDASTITYEISFNADGGIAVDPITVAKGESLTLPRTTKGGYLFKGWELNSNNYNSGDEYSPSASVSFKAKWQENLENLTYSGTNVTYRNKSTVVQIPVTYESKVSEFRGAWVSCYVGDYSASTNKTTMMNNLTSVLDVLESYNMNAVVFHIRIMNDACYKTDMAPIRSGFGSISTFESWDYLTWFIEECHKRGIQFHAWLNPYRISANGYSSEATVEDVAAKYASYPKNAASKAENILMTYRSDGNQGAILNPCKEEVQDYIVDVCLEIMENYDIDAIHFDDYFYAQLSSNNSFLNEADKADYEAYIATNPGCGYSASSSANKQQWRRDNVDNFIYKLHTAMTEFNVTHHRGVQLGIAPTGIYKNGNGVVTYNSDGSITTTGSNTGGQTHYSSYLFCDTVKWIRNEWIDYICPQSYWAFTHSSAGYADVVDWWDKVVEGTHVNLYTGMGLYMSTDYDSAKSWSTEAYEASNQVLYNTKFNNIKGTCIYVFNRIKTIQNNNSKIAYEGLMRIKNEYWVEYVPAPTTMADKYK
ncbi:MAG: InlB B-repeat-containing protein [Bacilli bacterium]|nr:InlB B-repeat-containing protein [Bacilli bacterium]